MGLKNLLNNLTMYKLVLYSLIIIVMWSVLLTILGVYSFNLGWMLGTLLLMGVVGWLSNTLIAKLFGITPNSESYLVTVLILFLIFSPASNIFELGWLALVVVVAMLSKYLIVINGKHIFNPAAFGAFIVGLGGMSAASWWVGSPALMIPVMVLGGLVIWKLKKLAMVGTFFGVSIITLFITNSGIVGDPVDFVYELFSSWPILFFGLFMFSEPATTPGRFYQQLIYGGIVGILFGLKFGFGPVFSTPELGLLIGNVFSFMVSGRRGLSLRLKSRQEIASKIYEFRFERGDMMFLPGQYLEWTLPHKQVDIRGNRRYFTMASSPTENELILATKMPDKPSSYKQALLSMKVGDKMQATNLAGDFVMDQNTKQVWIAGGIGVTPFRSMAKWLIDNNKNVETVLFYACNSYKELAYLDIFKEAEKVGIRLLPVLKDLSDAPKGLKIETGYVTEEMIKKYVPDFLQYKYYMSGPNIMIENFTKMLRGAGIKSSQIKTDFFPGY